LQDHHSHDNGVECWCCNTLDVNTLEDESGARVEIGTERIPDEECAGGNLGHAASGLMANGECSRFAPLLHIC